MHDIKAKRQHARTALCRKHTSRHIHKHIINMARWDESRVKMYGPLLILSCFSSHRIILYVYSIHLTAHTRGIFREPSSMSNISRGYEIMKIRRKMSGKIITTIAAKTKINNFFIKEQNFDYMLLLYAKCAKPNRHGSQCSVAWHKCSYN